MRFIAIVLTALMMIAAACGGTSDVGPAPPDAPAPGAERGPCLANGTCNAGLACLSNTCVRGSGPTGPVDGSSTGPRDTGPRTDGPGTPLDSSPGDGAATPDASDSSTGDAGDTTDASSADAADAADAQRVNDAGEPCPGAAIFHPGTETRNAGSSVPFVGRGRDSSCAPITGAKLVWTDSVGGAVIGTGETFNYIFNVTGTHTITLTSTDGAGASTTASVTFMIQ